MNSAQTLENLTIALSVSDNDDLPALGLSAKHLEDAMAEFARHLLALGARLAYGGDLRPGGFTELLFELVERHRRIGDNGVAAVNYLAWPVHIGKTADELEKWSEGLAGMGELRCLALNGTTLTMDQRKALPASSPSTLEWHLGLTAMRQAMLRETQARIVLGGRVEKYMGIMPGIAEEALLSLEAKRPLYLIGGFGGCARDIAETMGLVGCWAGSRPDWPGRGGFKAFSALDLNNGLTSEENALLARTPHIDQAVTLVLRGLLHFKNGVWTG